MNSIADDLGLTERSRDAYHQRLAWLFAEGCAIFGADAAAKMFRAQARTAPKMAPRMRTAPPRKRKGSHDPVGDRMLVASWKTFNGSSKTAWARMALENHALKSKGKVRAQKISPRSLVRRLDRLLNRDK
ncbi:hypothetical protein AB7G19_20070 [Bradyrhizobium sp. 215_C5_N1_1]|uniref:hypothetical protein n=1 Tax=unclassified Bradyrhizobium TaxID=2631580 RepID=UPI003F89EC34